MTALAIFIGLLFPAVNGYLLLHLLQGKTRVLDAIEQWAAGFAIGTTVTMFLTFCVHASTGMPLNRWGFLGVQIGLCVILFALSRILPRPVAPINTDIHRPQPPRWLRLTLWILVGTVIARAVFVGSVFLLMTPTFLDDTFDNWNLRGKLYFYDQALTLSLPGEEPEASKRSIGSYPPAVPLFKAWTASVAGNWSEPAANAVHLAWYLAALVLLGRTIRRLSGPGWDLFAVYLLGSIPLYMMHGTNPYADAFLSLNVLMAVLFPLRAMMAADEGSRRSLIRLGALSAGLLPFVKNEGLLLYLPPLLLLLAIGFVWGWKRQMISTKEVLHAVCWYAGCLLIFVLPWLAFKWANGLTFGNAKAIGDLGIGWQSGVLIAIAVNTFFEGNWHLFFPLLIGLVIWRRKAAFGLWIPLTAFVFIVFFGQMLIFLFTPLAVEARMQTGLARGGVQLLPAMSLLVVLLLADAGPQIKEAGIALARALRISSDIPHAKPEDTILHA